jgi:ABC-type dipeptide/oligopeptide/nickel transport system ATPase component
MNSKPQKLLQIEKLVLHFKTRAGTVQAVDGVDFELNSNRAVVVLASRVVERAHSPKPY